jgi:putative ABC transport system permease protein
MSRAPWQTIVGIVGDVRGVRLESPPTSQVYRSVWQGSNLAMALAVRTSSDPRGLEDSIRRAVRSVDADLPLYAVQPMSDVLASNLAERRFSMIVIGVFAGLALLLSTVGIYGVLAYLVDQRTSEIGLRMALGAETGDVMRLVIGEGLKLAALGIVIGAAASVVAARAIATMLFGVGPFDPLTFGGLALGLTAVAALACYLPARRATRIDPLSALRQE